MADTELCGNSQAELNKPFVKPYYTDSHGSKSIGEPDWKPHGRNVASYPLEATEQNSKLGGNGLDWFSSLRCASHEEPEEPVPHIRTGSKSGHNLVSKTTDSSRCDLQRTEQSSSDRMQNTRQRVQLVDEEQERMLQRRPLEMTLRMAVGAKGKVWDNRNEIPAASPGDKSYQVPEYSPNFHKQGCTLPVINFGGSLKYIPDTFVPLQDLPLVPKATYEQKEKAKKKDREIMEVVELDKWKPANPLVASLHPVGTHL